MGARRAIPPDAEVMMRRGMEPVLIKGGGTVKALSAEFLADLQVHWRKNRDQILDDVAKKYPQTYFSGMVALARIIRWEIGGPANTSVFAAQKRSWPSLSGRLGLRGAGYSSVSWHKWRVCRRSSSVN